MIITLTGFMGCGKTSVGKALGALLSRDVIDIDREVEKKSGLSIPEFFASKGEAAFRSMEKNVLEEVLFGENENVVVALGGGALKKEENISLVRSRSKCVYLRASAGNLAEWLGDGAEKERPLLRHESGISLEEHVSILLAEREPQYVAAASYIIDVDALTYEETALKIRELLFI